MSPLDDFTTFTQLHQANSPLLLVNIWDGAGAALLQQAGAKALEPVDLFCTNFVQPKRILGKARGV